MNFYLLFCICLISVISCNYISFNVNDNEGFNLRRDVYIRMVNLIRLIDKNLPKFTLVLPPLRQEYHWEENTVVDWSQVFDLKSMQRLIPVIDTEELRSVIGNYGGYVLHALSLRAHSNVNKFSTFEERKCDDSDKIYKYETVLDSIPQNKTLCYRLEMDIADFPDTFLNKYIQSMMDKEKENLEMFGRRKLIIHIENAENLIHGIHSEWSEMYWTARRSMRFSKDLVRVAKDFTSLYFGPLNMPHISDDWRKAIFQSSQTYSLMGGNYLAFHIRRRDFIHRLETDDPTYVDKTLETLEEVAKNITWWVKKTGISWVYVSTDMPLLEIDRLQKFVDPIVSKIKLVFGHRDWRFTYNPPEIAVIEQIICSYARYFVGTFQSTFTYRIFEERQLMGFPTVQTYNYVCVQRILQLHLSVNRDVEDTCARPAVWPVKYEKEYTLHNDRKTNTEYSSRTTSDEL